MDCDGKNTSSIFARFEGEVTAHCGSLLAAGDDSRGSKEGRGPGSTEIDRAQLHGRVEGFPVKVNLSPPSTRPPRRNQKFRFHFCLNLNSMFSHKGI